MNSLSVTIKDKGTFLNLVPVSFKSSHVSYLIYFVLINLEVTPNEFSDSCEMGWLRDAVLGRNDANLKVCFKVKPDEFV